MPRHRSQGEAPIAAVHVLDPLAQERLVEYWSMGMFSEDEPIELDLLRSGACVDLFTQEANITPVPHADDVCIGDRVHVRIEGRIGDEEDDDVEFAAFGLIYAFGALSFADATPRGNSMLDYRMQDQWTAADMLRHVRFVRGELHFHADYVRGRMMKTTVKVRKDGTFVLETVNRGEAALGWLARLKGEAPDSAAPDSGAPDSVLN